LQPLFIQKVCKKSSDSCVVRRRSKKDWSVQNFCGVEDQHAGKVKKIKIKVEVKEEELKRKMSIKKERGVPSRHIPFLTKYKPV
jgi:regulation of enolase protein 1 (concanavalin A-like superfamily)